MNECRENLSPLTLRSVKRFREVVVLQASDQKFPAVHEHRRAHLHMQPIVGTMVEKEDVA